MDIITAEIRKALLANGLRSAAGQDIDPEPVLKLFLPGGRGTWLITEMDPHDQDLLFGLCDPGLGEPELGDVRLSELKAIRAPGTGLGIERDASFRPDKRLSQYAQAASDAGFVRA